jgi:hypothetical protein
LTGGDAAEEMILQKAACPMKMTTERMTRAHDASPVVRVGARVRATAPGQG